MARLPLQPSNPQLAYAKLLGIIVPVGADRREVTNLISNTIGARKSKFLRESGIRPGSIIEKCSSYARYVVVDFAAGCDLKIRNLLTNNADRIPVGYFGEGGVFIASVEHCYTPPATHAHPIFVKYELREEGKHTAARLFEDLGKRLASDERFRNTYGEFWSRDAVARLTENLLDEYATPKPTALASKLERDAQQHPRTKYCAACGVQFVDASPSHHDRKCVTCRKNRALMGRERFCNICGARFTAPSSATMLCEAHRV